MNAYNDNLNLTETTKSLLASLDPRSKDVISRRYGIETDKPETLESIGREYGITRERVRQIQSQAKKNLQAMNDMLNPVSEFFLTIFKDHGGILAEDHVVAITKERLPESVSPQVVAFYLDVLAPY